MGSLRVISYVSRRGRLLLLLVPVLLSAACDPQAPGASGQLTVAPEANFDEGSTLEIRLLPDDGKSFDLAAAEFVDEDRHHQASISLAEIEFPFHYAIGGGIGHSEFEHWRVVAWISESEDVDRPKPGEWYATRVFSIADCGPAFSGYCGVMFDVDLAIESLRVGGSLRRVPHGL